MVKLIEASIATDKGTVWSYGFDYIAAKDRVWGSKFWKRWTPSLRSARRMGYKIVRVWVTDTEPIPEDLLRELREGLERRRPAFTNEWGVK